MKLKQFFFLIISYLVSFGYIYGQKICINSIINKSICKYGTKHIIDRYYFIKDSEKTNLEFCTDTLSCIGIDVVTKNEFENKLSLASRTNILQVTETLIDTNLLKIQLYFLDVDLQGYKDRYYQLSDLCKFYFVKKNGQWEILENDQLVVFDIKNLKRVKFIEIDDTEYRPQKDSTKIEIYVNRIPIPFKVKLKQKEIKGEIKTPISFCGRKEIQIEFEKIHKKKFSYKEINCSDRGYIIQGNLE